MTQDDIPLHKSSWGLASDPLVKSSQEFKADSGKSDPALLEKGMPRALEVCNDTLDYGCIKYEPHSWMNVPDAIRRYDSAARRHRRARDMGETHDVESYIMHLGHEIICNLFVLELMLRKDPSLRVPFNANPPQGHKK